MCPSHPTFTTMLGPEQSEELRAAAE
jgi:hypothetical protein